MQTAWPLTPLLERLIPYTHRLSYNPATAEGPVDHFLGGLAAVLGRYDEADTYFTQAAAFNNRVGAKFFAARTNLSWAGMLASRRTPGDAEKALELLTKAHTLAATQGYRTVERRAGEALQLLNP